MLTGEQVKIRWPPARMDQRPRRRRHPSTPREHRRRPRQPIQHWSRWSERPGGITELPESPKVGQENPLFTIPGTGQHDVDGFDIAM